MVPSPTSHTNDSHASLEEKTSAMDDTTEGLSSLSLAMPPPLPTSWLQLDAPLELSRDEYRNLLHQIRGNNNDDEAAMSLEDCRHEFLDAARSNDVDVARALWCCHGIELIVPQPTDNATSSWTDNHGNSALHMAAANGHVELVQFLIHNALSSTTDSTTDNPTTTPCDTGTTITWIHTANHAGNTALHWAAAQGQLAVVQVLLTVPDTDVLRRNAQGRSVLTEGFTSDNTDVVQALLSHASASEERLVQTHPAALSSTTSNSGTVEAKQDMEQDDNNNNNTEPMDEDQDNVKDMDTQEVSTLIHELIFGPSHARIQLSVQEQAIATNDQDAILGQTDPLVDTTGLGIWPASLILAQWLCDVQLSSPSGKEPLVVLELGAGCGVPSLVAARLWPRAHIFVTDFNPRTVEHARRNLQLNGLLPSTNIQAMEMNWQDSSTWPCQQPVVDCLLGSDLIYQTDMALVLHQTIRQILARPYGRFYYVAPCTGRQGPDVFWSHMQNDFNVQRLPVRPEYLANPLQSQDDDLCFLHFTELHSMSYELYVCTWKSSA
jgi:predicted nicotinamide N-methyase